MANKRLGVSWIVDVRGILLIIVLAVSSHQSIIKVFRIGDNIKLSCPSHIDSNLTWWFDGKSLDNNTVQINGNTLLQILNVTQKQQGMYWCGSSWKQGMNVTVLVGDLPSPPRNLYTTSYEFNKTLHFTAAKSTGGLPTRYTVYLNCTSNNNYCEFDKKGALYVPNILHNCESIKHVGSKSYQCDLQSAVLFATYIATVYAINALGNASASIVFQRPDSTYPSTIPAPPIQLNATEIQPGKVRLTWKIKPFTEYSDITYFRIEYKEKGTDNKKTWPKDQTGSDTTVVIGNLNADTTYYFYVKKQFRTSKSSSPFSTPAITSVHTKDADPKQPPQDLKCPMSKDDLSDVRTVVVTWKPPSRKHQNGPLKTYKITYGPSGSNNKTVVIVNASQTNINLTFHELHKTIQIYSKACNDYGCSGISNSCYVKGQPDSAIISKIPDDNKKTAIIVGAVMGIMCVAIIVAAVLFYFNRRKKTTTRRNSQINIEIDEVPYACIYDEPDNYEDEQEYDTPLV